MSGKKGSGGRPAIKWQDKDLSLFENCCGILCTKDEICGLFHITDKTLDRLVKLNYGLSFSGAYKKYSAQGKISLRRNQFKLSRTNAAMAIWLGKVILQQKESFDMEEAEEAFKQNLNNFFGNGKDEENN